MDKVLIIFPDKPWLTKHWVETHVITSNGQCRPQYARKRLGVSVTIAECFCAFYETLPKICRMCSSIAKFRNWSDGYADHCSTSCWAKDPRTIQKKQNTCLQKYGVSWHSKTAEYRQKVKDTSLRRFGKESFTQTEEYKKKATATSRQKYGADYKSSTKEFRDKVQVTNLVRYGETNPSKVPSIKDKKRASCLKSLGVSNPSKAPSIKAKKQDTMFKNWGMFHASTSFGKLQRRVTKLGNALGLEDPSIETMRDLLTSAAAPNKSCLDLSQELCQGNHPQRIRYFLDLFDLPCLDSAEKSNCRSVFELEVSSFLDSLLVPMELNRRSILGGKELDIYLPEHKIAIEANGIYWHSQKAGGKDPQYHLEKTESCEALGIQLFHIFEDEWSFNPIKKCIWKSKLKIAVGQAAHRILARKCKIVRPSSKECLEFLTRTHLQGYKPSSTRFGLEYNGKLVAVATFSRSRYEKDLLELDRLAFELDTVVIGGSSKLVSKAPFPFVSYANRRWSCGQVYDALGFQKLGSTPPNYWYVVSGVLESRIAWQKHKLKSKLEDFDESLTEWENMEAAGYDRIWDSGNLKFAWGF